MKFAPPFLRFLGMALALMTASSLVRTPLRGASNIVTVEMREDDVQLKQGALPPKKDGVSATTLSPEVEKKLQEILDKVKAQKGDSWNGQMKKEIDEIAKVTGLKDDGVLALTAASKQAVAASLSTWSPKLPDMALRELSALPKEQVVTMLDEAQLQIGAMAQTDFTGNIVAPDDEDAWTKALHQTLTPAQFDAWTQSQTKRKIEADKEIATVLKNGADRTRTEQTQQVMAECKSIEIVLKLPKDRADKLEDLGHTLIAQTVDKWSKREETFLLSMDENQRRPMLSNGFYMMTEADESPTSLPAWKDGVAHLLTGGELAQLQAARDVRKTRRQQVMGEVLVMLLDEKIAFTDSQRQKLEPIADRVVKDVSAFYPEANAGAYYSISPDSFYSVAGTINNSELKPILDSIQLRRWQTLAKTATPPTPDTDTAAGVAKQADYTEPEDVERAVSVFLYEKAENERNRSLAANTLKAEDIARVAGVNAESAERLQAAACGATESYLTTWKWFTEQQIRSQLQDLTPQNVRQRLDSLQDFFFQRNFGMSNQDTIWDKTLQTELTAQQQDAWKKETDAREAYRGNAIAGMALSEFDRREHLTDEQWEKLQPLIAGVVTDYSQGISQVFSSMNGVPWYLGGPYMLIPFAGLDDTDLKAILTKDQLDLWTGSQDFTNANNLWQVVKQMHVQRLRRTARAVIQD